MEGQDWYAVVSGGGACPECGFDAQQVDRADVGPSLLAEARRWGELLDRLAGLDDVLRRRPASGAWSAVEYACHVAGVFEVFAGRVERLRAEDGAELGWWDHEAAVSEERYAERPVPDVVAAIGDGAVRLALALPRLDDPPAWDRAGTRRPGERFTIEGIARYALHESVHHRLDAQRSAGAGAG